VTVRVLSFVRCVASGHVWIASRRFPGIAICRRCGVRGEELGYRPAQRRQAPRAAVGSKRAPDESRIQRGWLERRMTRRQRIAHEIAASGFGRLSRWQQILGLAAFAVLCAVVLMR
jgi:hypothetical protein